MITFRSKKRRHVNKVKDHIFSLHMKMVRELNDFHKLEGIELHIRASEIKSIASRMHELKEYLRLILL